MPEQISKNLSDQRGPLAWKRASGLVVLAAIVALIISGTPGLRAEAAMAPASGAPQQSGEVPQALHLLVGRSLIISSPSRIKRVSLADPSIAEAIVVSPTQVLVNGRAPGGVSLIIWDENEQSQAFEVSVDIDVLSLSGKNPRSVSG